MPREEVRAPPVGSGAFDVVACASSAGERLEAGTVYIAPPHRHPLVNPDGRLELADSELVHFLRPSADLLFESVAASFGDRAIAVVLSGPGKDASMGVTAIKNTRGMVIVQDPGTAGGDADEEPRPPPQPSRPGSGRWR